MRSRERTDSLPTLRMTLRDYYCRKRAHYRREDHAVYDRDLRRLFSDLPADARRKAAARFLRERRRELVDLVTRRTGQHRFVVDDVVTGMIRRSRELGLRLAGSERRSREGAAVLLALNLARIRRMRHLEYVR